MSTVTSATKDDAMTSFITNEDYKTFIGKNSEKYLAKFDKFDVGGIDNFSATWNWSAFLVPSLWLLYRKMYGWAIFSFVFLLIPIIGAIIVRIVFGISANYIYFKHAKKKLLEIKQLHPASETQKNIMIIKGGVHNVALITGVAIIPFVFLGVITVPQFSAYRERGYCAAAKADIHIAYTSAQALYSDNPDTNISHIGELEKYGLQKSKDVNIEVISGRINDLKISSKHSGCKKTYYVDSKGSISEY